MQVYAGEGANTQAASGQLDELGPLLAPLGLPSGFLQDFPWEFSFWTIFANLWASLSGLSTYLSL